MIGAEGDEADAGAAERAGARVVRDHAAGVDLLTRPGQLEAQVELRAQRVRGVARALHGQSAGADLLGLAELNAPARQLLDGEGGRDPGRGPALASCLSPVV